MDTKSDGPVGPETGDGQSNEKGKKKISRNTGSTPRYIKLSEHKKPNKNFQPNRPAIWPVKPATMKAQPTARINELAKPKPNHDGFKARESEGKSKTVSRSSPEWPLRWETLNAGASSRIHELAKPKQVHRDWQADRSPYAMITEAALTVASSPRTDLLAQHKRHADPLVKVSYLWDYPYWDNEISEATRTYSPTERIRKLAKPKGDYARLHSQ
ncbi:sperm microtubule associated protein 2-like isoform X3 [Narcine bancroftii]|uniref:sperm microtubule associated protein 2-like isoform X3 n=1 Tax=Narcine bancroftii TaxID=1343680 RepID=UPI003831343E